MKSLWNASSQTTPLISNDELTQLLAISGELEDELALTKAFNTHHFYMQFLEFTLANASNNDLPTLTLNEQHLLEQIAVRCEMDKHKLSAAGLIHLDVAPSNLRKKFIYLSPVV
jgi:hypothetical protein